MIKEIQHCRICGSADLVPVTHLGCQALTGWFPRTRDEEVPVAPLELVKCDDGHPQRCGLVQLRHSFDPRLIYGDRYGYRSGLNTSMREHIAKTIADLRSRIRLEEGDVIVDIGSNDGTLLGNFEAGRFQLIGIDPTADKFRRYYRDDIMTVPEFFHPGQLNGILGDQKVKLITALSMMYDLEDPQTFMSQVRELLHRGGMWLIEQSYMPSMINGTAYDTICHEHLEYYGLKQIKWMADRAGLKIIDVYFNHINGGSFAVVFARDDAAYPEAGQLISKILQQESRQQFDSTQPFVAFEKAVRQHRQKLINTLDALRQEGATVLGYGASTKGNVLLQYCGLGPAEIPLILEINEDKFDCFTPGTGIPIVCEDAMARINPDYLLVLPWHYKDMIIRKERAFLQKGGGLIFPLPAVSLKQSTPKPQATHERSAKLSPGCR
ncbi:MAG: class I SAM-dependent methyltransferase [Candidatus Omnitrophica bacterium]|nr:class I SAM-dependent methyltransferase [Candidatus Omnitrophota bacterium]